MRRADEPRYDFKPRQRTTQIIYGERQHLRAVLISIRNFQREHHNLERETELLHRLIDARTAELHRINPNFDEQLNEARDADASAETLARLAFAAPEDDWLLLRTIAENPNTPSEVLARLASHPYEAVRQNIARHSQATGETLDKLASESNRDLWLLVACNEFAPPELRERLRARVLPETSAAAD
jgi:type I site-specific restriction-modification system R (restriction) subunit